MTSRTFHLAVWILAIAQSVGLCSCLVRQCEDEHEHATTTLSAEHSVAQDHSHAHSRLHHDVKLPARSALELLSRMASASLTCVIDTLPGFADVAAAPVDVGPPPDIARAHRNLPLLN